MLSHFNDFDILSLSYRLILLTSHTSDFILTGTFPAFNSGAGNWSLPNDFNVLGIMLRKQDISPSQAGPPSHITDLNILYFS